MVVNKEITLKFSDERGEENRERDEACEKNPPIMRLTISTEKGKYNCTSDLIPEVVYEMRENG